MSNILRTQFIAEIGTGDRWEEFFQDWVESAPAGGEHQKQRVTCPENATTVLWAATGPLQDFCAFCARIVSGANVVVRFGDGSNTVDLQLTSVGPMLQFGDQIGFDGAALAAITSISVVKADETGDTVVEFMVAR